MLGPRSQFLECSREALYKQALERLEAARSEKEGMGGIPSTETPDQYWDTFLAL